MYLDIVEIADLLSIWYTVNGARTSIKILRIPDDIRNYDAFLKHIRERLRQINIVCSLFLKQKKSILKIGFGKMTQTKFGVS